MFSATYVGVILLGLLHGFEPGHGWPVAVLYSMKRKNPVLSAAISSSVIGLGHLVSSIAVVVAYVLFQKWLNFDAPWIKYVAAGLLLVLAVKLYFEKVDDLKNQHGHTHPGILETEHEHEHMHPGQAPHTHKHKHGPAVALNLLGLASFAFILGFAHEEEIALLALVASGLNAWVLMVSYALSVVIGLVAVTMIGVKIYERFQPKLARFDKYVPKISAGILLIMAILIVLV